MISSLVFNLEKKFEKIGAKVRVVFVDDRRLGRGRTWQQSTPVRVNIITKKGEEQFELAIRKNLADSLADNLDLTVLEVLPKDRHLVLLAKHTDRQGNVVSKDHFLCGHDERHFFVASVQAVTTVGAAKESLKPAEILSNETGLNTKKRNRRKTKAFTRQGEWFFVPSDISPPSVLILKEEPLIRGSGSKPHTAQFAFRAGGISVLVCSKYPNGLNQLEYEALIAVDPGAKQYGWRQMRRDAIVYVKGRVKHADHATVVLEKWHRVLINTEQRSDSVGFLD